jgi:hypothetical protein
MGTDSAASAGPNPTALVHTCGRCREIFSFDLTSESRPREGDWWLCPACRTKLLGDTDKTDARWR